MKRTWILLPFLLVANLLSAIDKTTEFKTTSLKTINCSLMTPEEWFVYDRSNSSTKSWIITPADLNLGPYKTGVSIDTLSNVKQNTGVKASKWVADRIQNKSTSLQIISSESGPTNDYFQVSKLVTKEVYSPGKKEYITSRKIYSWYWNDEHDFVICMESMTPEKSWNSMSAVLEKINKLEFDVTEWKKMLKKGEE